MRSANCVPSIRLPSATLRRSSCTVRKSRCSTWDGGTVPQGLTSAQLNLSYCVATLLIDGEVFVDQFTEEKLTDPERMALAEKVEMRHDPAITARGPKFRQMVRAEIYLKDGTRLERTLETSRRKKSFASDAEVVEKFEKLAVHVLSKDQVAKLCDGVLDLENLPDAAQIAHLLEKR